MSDIQLRQTYYDRIYNYRPPWILRFGLTVIFLYLIIVLFVTHFIKFPDVVPATAAITTLNPPAHLVARVNSKIDTIFVVEGQKVVREEVLVILESPTRFEDIKLVQNYLEILNVILQDSIRKYIPNPSFFRNDIELGEIQPFYSELILAYNSYFNFYQSSFFDDEILSLKYQLTNKKQFINRLNEKKTILHQQYLLSLKLFQRDSVLFRNEVISELEYENSRQKLLQFKASLVEMDLNIINQNSVISQLKNNLDELIYNNNLKEKQLNASLEQASRLLNANLQRWKQSYILTSPINGNVTFTEYWSKTQNVITGDVVVSVVPVDTTLIKVRVQFPIQNSGKVKTGQRVNIKLVNYPYQEFGFLVGHMGTISSIPNNLLYSAEVLLQDGLTTSYGEKLPMVHQLSGNAEILTDDISLLTRFFSPLRAIFDTRVSNNEIKIENEKK